MQWTYLAYLGAIKEANGAAMSIGRITTFLDAYIERDMLEGALDEAGAPMHEWKDTFNVPAHQSRQFAVRYDDRPGDWMFHCHILEHAAGGMMGTFVVEA